jgi:hypothetical protein
VADEPPLRHWHRLHQPPQARGARIRPDALFGITLFFEPRDLGASAAEPSFTTMISSFPHPLGEGIQTGMAACFGVNQFPNPRERAAAAHGARRWHQRYPTWRWRSKNSFQTPLTTGGIDGGCPQWSAPHFVFEEPTC